MQAAKKRMAALRSKYKAKRSFVAMIDQEMEWAAGDRLRPPNCWRLGVPLYPDQSARLGLHPVVADSAKQL
jgi:hypothetical protein